MPWTELVTLADTTLSTLSADHGCWNGDRVTVEGVVEGTAFA